MNTTKAKQVENANREAIRRIQESRVELVGIGRAEDEISFFTRGHALLHSGPPVDWENMCDAMRNAVCGAAVYEGWAETVKEAYLLAQSGGIRFGSNNENGAVGPMAGIISPSMPVFLFQNAAFLNRACVTMNEGLGKTLRFGANDAEVIGRLKWMERTLAPILAQALELGGPVDITELIARGIQRGDDCHNRNKASTGLFIRRIAPWMVRCSRSKEEIAQALAFMDANDHFFLNLSMGHCKATMDNLIGIPDSTIVTCMSTNGYQLGIRVAGAGKQWFLEQAPYAQGNYFKGFTLENASRVMGDSYISEAAGLGGFAMGAALGIGQFIGVNTQQAQEFSLRMYQICVAEHERFKIPVFDFRGTPLGIDVRRVVETEILPVINTGIAHKDPGVGQIGAGVVYPPMGCFHQAAKHLKRE